MLYTPWRQSIVYKVRVALCECAFNLIDLSLDRGDMRRLNKTKQLYEKISIILRLALLLIRKVDGLFYYYFGTIEF